MKVRSPLNIEAPSLDSIPESNNGHSVTYQVKTITPIYGGGVEAGIPDIDMPIRAAAIRGQLRYWWRFLAMNREDNRLSGEALFQEERRIWGGMTDDLDEDGSSKVFVRIFDVTGFKKPEPCCSYQAYQRDGQTKYRLNYLHEIPQYAMFPGQGKLPSAADYNEDTDKPHEVILPKITFQLNISVKTIEQDNKNGLSTGDWKHVNESIRWWACFGGIGTRTRRGLGSVEIINNEFKYLTAEDVEKYNCKLTFLESNGAMNAWNKSIEILQKFRQGVGVGRDSGNGPRPGRSRWSEPDTIREITHMPGHPIEHPARQSFPRAALGLPIIFEIRGRGEPPKTELIPLFSSQGKTVEGTRMASPLILKAIATNNGYKSIALCLPTQFHEKLSVRLKSSQNNRSLPADFEDGNWWDDSKAQDVRPINDNDGTDALAAFMNFFAKGGE